VARNPELEAILEARYSWESAAPSEKAKLRDLYYHLLDQARARHHSKGIKITRDELIDAMSDEFREFRRARDRELAAKVQRLR
jgi:hypothetical protein